MDSTEMPTEKWEREDVEQENVTFNAIYRSLFPMFLSGMADPSALPQAVSAFQACHFIGMPECEVGLPSYQPDFQSVIQ